MSATCGRPAGGARIGAQLHHRAAIGLDAERRDARQRARPDRPRRRRRRPASSAANVARRASRSASRRRAASPRCSAAPVDQHARPPRRAARERMRRAARRRRYRRSSARSTPSVQSARSPGTMRARIDPLERDAACRRTRRGTRRSRPRPSARPMWSEPSGSRKPPSRSAGARRGGQRLDRRGRHRSPTRTPPSARSRDSPAASSASSSSTRACGADRGGQARAGDARRRRSRCRSASSRGARASRKASIAAKRAVAHRIGLAQDLVRRFGAEAHQLARRAAAPRPRARRADRPARRPRRPASAIGVVSVASRGSRAQRRASTRTPRPASAQLGGPSASVGRLRVPPALVGVARRRRASAAPAATPLRPGRSSPFHAGARRIAAAAPCSRASRSPSRAPERRAQPEHRRDQHRRVGIDRALEPARAAPDARPSNAPSSDVRPGALAAPVAPERGADRRSSGAKSSTWPTSRVGDSRPDPPCPRQSNDVDRPAARVPDARTLSRYFSKMSPRPPWNRIAPARVARPASRTGAAPSRRARASVDTRASAGNRAAEVVGIGHRRAWLRFRKPCRLGLCLMGWDISFAGAARRARRCCWCRRASRTRARARSPTGRTPRSRCSRRSGGGRTGCRSGPTWRCSSALARGRLRAVLRRVRARPDGRRRRQADRRAGAVAAARARCIGC